MVLLMIVVVMILVTINNADDCNIIYMYIYMCVCDEDGAYSNNSVFFKPTFCLLVFSKTYQSSKVDHSWVVGKMLTEPTL